MENIFKNLHSNQKIVIYEMLKRGIDVEIFDEEKEIVRCSYNNHIEYLYDRDSSIVPYNMSVIAGNKGITKRILQDAGITTPLGLSFNVENIDAFLKVFDALGGCVTIKPIYGSHGDYVYTNITNKIELLKYLNKIATSCGPVDVLIEENYIGKEYRIFITKNKDYAVLNRDPASVVGDGIHTLYELIILENYRRNNPKINALCDITLDDETIKFLNEHGKSLEYIPKNNELVYLKYTSNVAKGGLCIDCTDIVHPSVIEIAQKTLNAFPGLPYIGIDFMTNTITEMQNEDSYRIIEINTVPGVNMHFRPAIGKSRNIASFMVDLIYPETKNLLKESDDYEESYDGKPSLLSK